MLKSVLVSLLVVCSFIVAQDKNHAGSWGSHTGPHAPGSAPRAIDWDVQAQLVSQHAPSSAWRAQNPGWVIVFDQRTSFPWRAYGPGIQVASAGAGKDEIAAAAAAQRDVLAKVCGFEPTDFVFFNATKAGGIWFVDFEQRISGAPVQNGGLTMRIDAHGRLVLWGGRLVRPDNVARAAGVTKESAISLALSHLVNEGFVNARTVIDPPSAKLVVHVSDQSDNLVPTLTWLVETHTEDPMAVWNIYIDTTTGSVVEYWNTICEAGGDEDETLTEAAKPLIAPMLATFSGTASGTVHDHVLPSAAPVAGVLQDLYVNCNGTNVTTDSAGMYSFNGGGASVPVTSIMSGPHSTCRNFNNTTGVSGTQPSFSGTGSTGTTDVVWDATNSLVEERDAFFFVNIAWHNLMLHDPGQTLFSASLNTNVNYSGTCNAFYTTSPLSVNFYPAGGGCINTATEASIPIHEYGHHVTTTEFAAVGRTVPGSLQEGLSDCQAASYTDSNVIGVGFQGVGTSIRNLDNTCQYPSSCGTEVHSWGLVIGACYWHTRVQFANAYGAAGKTQLDNYMYQAFHGGPQDQVEMLLDMLTLNDNDANLANGTPDALKFYQGFTVQHSVPFPIAGTSFNVTHLPLKDTMDQLQNYQVHATAAPSAVFGGSITAGTLSYSLNGGSYTTVSMSLQGGEYVASIPVQPVGTLINYYMNFTDSNTFIQKFPTGSYSFRTYRLQQFFYDGFEVASGWTHAQVATQDDWQNNAPMNPTHQYDPHSAYEGTKVWGNDLSIPGQFGGNGTYASNANNHLDSPTLNCTGKTNVSIVYRRWLTVEDGLYDHARIYVSNNNGASYTVVWQNPAGNGTQNFIDTSWVEHTINISSLADNQAQVKVRYELVADASVQFGGWNIDAFSLSSGSAVTLPVTNQGSNTPGGAGDIRVTGVQGDSVILAVDVSTQTTYYGGIGTMSLNVGSPNLIILYDGSQSLPAGGTLDLNFTVPPLSGLNVWFEGALLPGGSTNSLLITNVLQYTIL